MSQYYSDKILQNRNQEIVTKQLKDSLKKALSVYEERNGQLPQHFIIYRDGVGDT
jgi:Tfp pilus assembly PilM family ATPase